MTLRQTHKQTRKERKRLAQAGAYRDSVRLARLCKQADTIQRLIAKGEK